MEIKQKQIILPESTCRELPWPVGNQSPDLPLALLCREQECLTRPVESYTTSYHTFSLGALISPVISQGHMDITTCILSTESPGPQAEKRSHFLLHYYLIMPMTL